MRKDLGPQPAIFPMPVLMIAAYDEKGTVNVMNAAWGMISDIKQITLFLAEDRKTLKNIRVSKAFTVSLATKDTMAAADYFGMVSGNSVPDKFARSGLHAVKSSHVNAPVINEFPVAIECELEQEVRSGDFYAVVGKIINISADEKALDENGKINPLKLNAIMFDQFQHGYYSVGEKAGQAWNEGKKFIKK